MKLPTLALLLAGTSAGCGSTRDTSQAPPPGAGTAPDTSAKTSPAAEMPALLYVGSSTIANFMHDAERPYGKARIIVDSVPESLGGERAIQDGNADLAGVAWEPLEETLAMGIEATFLGTDTIALVVNEKNPVTKLGLEQLRGIYTGKIRNWKELGGPDLEIVPLAVGRESATRSVFRALALGGEPYAPSARIVTPDSDIPMEVEAEPGAIGTISYAFLCAGGVVRVLNIEGAQPLPEDTDYPIVRPLHLLWKPENPKAASFISWVKSPPGQEVLARCFGKPREIPRIPRPAPE
jgi:phosphate transport system substrate-binding protein